MMWVGEEPGGHHREKGKRKGERRGKERSRCGIRKGPRHDARLKKGRNGKEGMRNAKCAAAMRHPEEEEKTGKKLLISRTLWTH